MRTSSHSMMLLLTYVLFVIVPFMFSHVPNRQSSFYESDNAVATDKLILHE